MRCVGTGLLVLVIMGQMVACRSALRPSDLPAYDLKHPLDLPPSLSSSTIAPLVGSPLIKAQSDIAQIHRSLTLPSFLASSELVSAAGAAVKHQEPVRVAQRAYVEGRAAWRAGNSVEAKHQLQIAHRLAPSSAEILRLLGWIYTASGNKVKGAYYLEKAATIDSDHAESLLLLSRFALEQGQWKDAIAGLLHVLGLIKSQSRCDPALEPLIRYYLAVALRHEGYVLAAADQFDQYFVRPRPGLRSSRWARELMFLDRQRGQSAMVLGDLLNCLDRPNDSRAAYVRAGQYGVSDLLELIRRQIYTDLRLGDVDGAIERVVQIINARPDDAAVLDLPGYLHAQGISATVLGDRLIPLYINHDRPAGLALALAKFLRPDAGRTLLSEHMRIRPGDRRVLGRLLELLLASDMPVDGAVIDAVRITAGASMAVPSLASIYCHMLVHLADDPGTLITAIDHLPDHRSQEPIIRVIRALAQVAAGERSVAVQTLESVLAVAPTLDVVRVELVRLMVETDRFDRAAELLEPLASTQQSDIVQLRVAVLIATGRSREALDLVDQVLRVGANDSRLYIQKARLQQRLGDAAAAEQTLLDALNRRPSEQALYAELFAMYDQNLVPDSIRQYQRLMRRMLGVIPHSRLARLKRAAWFEAKGQLDQAEPLLVGLLAENDRDLAAVGLLIHLYVRDKRQDDAVTLLERLVESYPRDLEVLLLASSLYLDPIKDADRLVAVERRILELEPNGSQRFYRLAVLLLLVMEQPEQAIEVLDQALARESVDSPRELLSLLWQALWQLDRVPEADRRLREAVVRFPNHAADIGYMRALLAGASEDDQKSEQIMVKILVDHPNHAATNNDLAYTWTQQDRNLDQALEMINRAIEVEPDNEAFLDSKGWVLYKRGDFQGAATWLRRALTLVKRGGAAEGPLGRVGSDERAQTQAVIGDHLGDALFRLGRNQAALQAWIEARRQLTPNVSQSSAELVGLRDRLAQKINAVREGRSPPVTKLLEAVNQNVAP